MRSHLLLPLLIAALAGGVAGFVASRFAGELAAPIERVPVARSPLGAGSREAASSEASLAGEVAALEVALLDVQRRLERLEARAPSARTEPAAALDPSELEELRAGLEDLRASGLLTSPTRLEEALDERLERRRERDAAIDVLRGDSDGTLDERARALGAWLGLEAEALEPIRALLERRTQQRMEVLRRWTQGEAVQPLEDRARADDLELRRGLEALVSGPPWQRLQELYDRIENDAE